MALARFLTDLESIDESLREQYVSDGKGAYKLDIDGADPKLDEFRTNNRAQHSEIEKLKKLMKPFEGVDMGVIKQAQDMKAQFDADEEKKLFEEGNIKEIVKRRTLVAVEEAEKRVTAAQTTLAEKETVVGSLKSRLATLTVDQDVRKALEGAGIKVRTGAMEDVLTRARQTWIIGEDGQMTPVDGKGEVRFGGDANQLSMKEFVTKDLLEGAGHLFEGASGGGASGGKPGAGRPGQRTVDANDATAFGRSLEDIASGKVTAVRSEDT